MSVTDCVLRDLEITLKNPTARFLSTNAYVGKLRDGPTTPIVVAVRRMQEFPATLAQVRAAAKAAGFATRDAYVAPPDADGRWPLESNDDIDYAAWPAVVIEPVAETKAEAETTTPAMCYVSPYALAAVTLAKAELETAARGLAQTVLDRLADSFIGKAWKESPGVHVTWAMLDGSGDMYFRPIYVLLHKQGKFAVALATAVCEWARRFPGLRVTTAKNDFGICPVSGTYDEKAFPPGVSYWINVIITVQEFPTRRVHCDDKMYLFDDRTSAIELDFARAAFAAMCAVSKEASAE